MQTTGRSSRRHWATPIFGVSMGLVYLCVFHDRGRARVGRREPRDHARLKRRGGNCRTAQRTGKGSAGPS